MFSKFLAATLPQPTIKFTQDSLQLSLLLEQTKTNSAKKLHEQELEVRLYQAQLKSLGGPPTIPDLDPADFSTFQSYSATIPKAKQEIALSNYYQMQLHRYTTLLTKIQRAKAKKSNNEALLAEMKNKLAYLTRDLNEGYDNLEKVRSRLEDWTKAEEKAANELVRAQSIHKQILQSSRNKLTHEQISEKMTEMLKKTYDSDNQWLSKAETIAKGLDGPNQSQLLDQLKTLTQNL